MRKTAALLLVLALVTALAAPVLADFAYARIQARLSERMATRTGPGTQYDEPGSFFSAGTDVTLISRAYDERNGIWWVQADFTYGGRRYRAYTGAKRFSGLNLSRLPVEVQMGWGYTGTLGEGFLGPGMDYQAVRRIPAQVHALITGYEYNGREDRDYIQIDFYDSGIGCRRRAWVPEWSFDAEYNDYGMDW